VLFAPAGFWVEMKTISTAYEEGDTGDERLYLWGIAWKMFLDHPVFGVGTGNFGIRSPEYQDPDRTGWAVHTWGRVAHSIYFTVLSEQGAIGTGLFLLIIGWCFRARRGALRRARENPEDESARSVSLMSSGLLAAIASFLATGLFLSVLYYPVFWLLVGLLASLTTCDENERELRGSGTGTEELA
jgi:O-antigen ligase